MRWRFRHPLRDRAVLQQHVRRTRIKNGLLPAVVADADVSELGSLVAAVPALPVTVDLERQTIARGNRTFAFVHSMR